MGESKILVRALLQERGNRTPGFIGSEECSGRIDQTAGYRIGCQFACDLSQVVGGRSDGLRVLTEKCSYAVVDKVESIRHTIVCPALDGLSGAMEHLGIQRDRRQRLQRWR
ncbi:hypothetical protein GCM10011588_39460 [Nocardia jinanensis]|uniref:Uncharacterized protein n=1 Tax=Nocardia jinanensis TaxID=382504 RepID=A0A917RRK8_9NOCA|nr:hypothetical protein GCM10011588_39460 [Nocardia jinanensis]